MMESQSNPRTTAGRSLLDDTDAWAIVREWASDTINFPAFDQKMQNFGDRYVSSEWNHICNRIFDLSEDGDTMGATTYVEEQMKSRGLLSTPASAKAKGKRKAEDSKHRPRRRKRARRTASSFLDVEAQVDEEEDSSGEEGENDGNDFIVEEGTETTLRPVAVPPMRVHPVSERAGPSTYLSTVDNIARHFLPSTLDHLDDDEYNRQLDYYAGHDLGEDELEEESDVRQVLEPAEIWNSIHDWILGTQDYYTLVELIDYQYDFNPKIQYWEEFLSRLAFLEDLEKRDEYFKSISLADHLRQIADYQIPSATRESSPRLMFQDTPRPEETPRDGVWVVKIVPRSSAKYIVNAWKNQQLDAKVDRYLPGRATVCASYPNAFLHAVPPSHRSCIRGWSLIPVEDRIPRDLFGRPPPSLPAWYTISKRGIFKGDIAYALDFDDETMEFQILVAPRRLKSKKPHAKQRLGQFARARRLFTPEEHCGELQPSRHGLQCYRHREQVFVAGLLLMRVNINQIVPVLAPSPAQIALHVASMVNPSFMKATYQKYNQVFWKSGDRVTISDSTHLGEHGNIVTIEPEAESAVVRLFDGPEHPIPISLLSRLYHVGDAVRVISDPFSDHLSTHHELIGRSGLISQIDCETGEATVTEGNVEFQVSQHLLESHISDQRVSALVGFLDPSVVESPNPIQQVEVGDTVEVRRGPHKTATGFVLSVERSAGTLRFRSLVDGVEHKVPIDSVSFTPDHRALKFTPERGYDVMQGDMVVVIRGDFWGKYGKVISVCLEDKTLVVAPLESTASAFRLPITYFAHPWTVRNRDENERYVEKEVLIIHGEFRGWRGTLINVTQDKCTVLRGVSSRYTCSLDHVVVRGSQTRLSGRALTPQEILIVASAFARAEISGVSGREGTPPPPETHLSGHEAEIADAAPSATFNPWEVDEADHEQLDGPALKVHGFLLHPTVLESLKNLHAVFQITGGRGTYIGRLAKTQVPSPLQTEQGPVPRGQIAVLFTAHTKGAHLLRETLSETSLRVYHPVKKNTFCMVIEKKEGGGGELVGSVLSVTRVYKNEKVAVRRTDGTPAAEEFLPMSRVIVVEPRT